MPGIAITAGSTRRVASLSRKFASSANSTVTGSLWSPTGSTGRPFPARLWSSIGLKAPENIVQCRQALSLVQDLADPPHERFGNEGFLSEIPSVPPNPVVNDRVVGVPGHAKHLRFPVQGRRAPPCVFRSRELSFLNGAEFARYHRWRLVPFQLKAAALFARDRLLGPKPQSTGSGREELEHHEQTFKDLYARIVAKPDLAC